MGHDTKNKGWDWIVNFYAKPEVRSACLVLQDKYGVDVTFLLFLCWLDARNISLKEHYLTVHRNTENIRNRIGFIRKFRRLISKIPGLRALKPRILDWELNQERRYFKILNRQEIQEEKPGAAIQAKHYITYQGALKTAACRIILRELGL